MNERDRLRIVNEINYSLKIKQDYEKKQKELDLLARNELVLRYKKLKEELTEFKNNDFENKTDKSIITSTFYQQISHRSFIDGCFHNIWIYMGSYYGNHGKDNYIHKCENEKHKFFVCNFYFCLECGRSISVHKWEQFEKTHFVLKDRNIDGEKFYKLQLFYYETLFENNVEDTFGHVVQEFQKIKAK